MSRRTLEIILVGKDVSGSKTIAGVSVAADSMAAKLDRAGRTLQSAGGKMAIGFTLPITLAARAALAEMSEAQTTLAQTNAVLRSTGGVANVTASDIERLSQAELRKSGIDDELIRSGANLLLTFKNVRNEVGEGNNVFDRALRAANDLSVSGFGDMASTSKMLGKALNDPLAGMTALSRAGVTFTADQKEAIRALVESGRVLDAQKLILREVESQVGGAAAAYGDTLPGKIGRAREALLNSAGLIIGTAAPALEVLASGAEALAGFLDGLPGPLKAVVTGLAGIVAVAGPAMFVVGGMMRNFAALEARAPGAAAKLSSVGGVLGKIGLAGAAVGVVVGVVEALDSLNTSDLEGAFEALDEGPRKARNAMHELVGALEQLKRDADLGGLPQQTGMYSDRIREMRDEMRKLASESPDLARVFIEQARDAGMAKGQIEILEKILNRTAGSNDRLEGATDRATQRMVEEGRAAELTKGQLEGLKQKGDELINSQLGLVGAQLNTEQAIKSYNDAVAQSGAGSFEARNAQLQLTESILAQGKAVFDETMLTSTATGEKKKFQEATAAQKAQLMFLAGTLAPGSPLRAQLDAYIGTLNSIPPGKSTTLTLKTNFTAANALGNVGNVIANVALNFPGRAKGGPVGPGSYLVGEAPGYAEVLHLNAGSSGYVTSAHELRSGAMSGGGGGDLHLTLQVGDEVLDNIIVKGVIKGGQNGRFRGLHLTGVTTD